MSDSAGTEKQPVKRYDFVLKHGKHNTPEEGCCIMEQSAVVRDRPFTDCDPTACPVLTRWAQNMNDGNFWRGDDARRTEVLGEIAHDGRLLDTRGTLEVELRRAYLGIDWTIRVLAPACCDLVEDLKPHAVALRALDEIKDVASAKAAMPAINKAWSDARDARDALAALAARADESQRTLFSLQESVARLLQRMIDVK